MKAEKRVRGPVAMVQEREIKVVILEMMREEWIQKIALR